VELGQWLPLGQSGQGHLGFEISREAATGAFWSHGVD
jgi:hypothetical protein